ncbi:ABC transporter permease subunit [Streptomyces sp. NPDC058420]|uniref:ABC transporter permease subunit n=1 Tax=Streptomyces sp. NPDC058420 TaxID=3346489 RepID=UPI00364CD301
MLRFLVRRFLGAVVILFLLSIVTFLLFFGMPRDPGLLMCGKTCNPTSLANIHHVLGLDKPISTQYGIFLKNLVMGSNGFAQGPCPAPCFGYSYHTNDQVWATLIDRLPTTVSLTLGGAIITEYTFSLPGLGNLAVQAVFYSDLPLLLGVMIFSATMILLFNIIVDACYAFIDPRVRLA